MAETPENMSTGQGPGNPAPKADGGVAPTSIPIPDLKAAEVFAESLKNANRRLSELGEEGKETADALQSLNMMRGKLNSAMKEEIETKNELIKKHEERVKSEERYSAVQRELTEIEQKYAKFRKDDGSLTQTAQKLYIQDTRKLKEEMLRLNLTIARVTASHREAEIAHKKAVETANKWSENFKENIESIREMPGAGKIVKDWLAQLEKSFRKASETQTEAAVEGLHRIESTMEKYSRARLEAELEAEEMETEAQRKASLRRMKSRMEDAAGTAAREVAATGGVVGVSEIFAAQSVMGDLTETFKKYLGREASGEQLQQFNAIAKMIQSMGKGEAIDENTATEMGKRIQEAIGTPLTPEMVELLKKSLEETKRQRESGEIGQEQVVIAMGNNADVIDSLQKTISDNTIETINILKQEEVNKLIEQGIRADQARGIVERRAQTRGSELQLAIAREQKKSLQAIETATNLSRDRTIDVLLLNLDQMNDNQRSSIEATVEERFIIPKWAGMLIGAYNNSIAVYKEEFNRLSDLFEGSTGTTRILMMLAMGIGIGVSYISSYIKKVYDIVSTSLKFVGGSFASVFKGIVYFADKILGRDFARALFNIPRMLSGAIRPIFGMLMAPFRTAGSFLATVFKPLMFVLKPLVSGLGGLGSGMTALGQAVPFVGKFLGFVPKIMGAFQLGLRIGSALFPPLFAIINIITAIVGAFRGFGQGGLKGAIIGAISQILAGFTFGLLSFQDIFDFINNTFGPVFEGIVDILQFAYNTVLKPMVDFGRKVFAIMKGEGSIIGKIFKIIGEFVIMYLKVLAGVLLTTFIKLPILIIKAVGYVLKFLFVDIPQMIVDGIAWLWNWITSGVWLEDLYNFGSWAGEKLKEFWNWLLNSVADAFAGFPLVGEYISGKIRPSEDQKKVAAEEARPSEYQKKVAAEEAATKPLTKAIKEANVAKSSALQSQQAFAANMANYPTYGTPSTVPLVVNGGVLVTPSGVPIQPGTAISVTAVRIAQAQAQAASRQQTGSAMAQVNNNQTLIGGNGGTPIIPIPPNRNTDPTYRALLFMEAPAL